MIMTYRNDNSNLYLLNDVAENLSCVCDENFNCNALAITLAKMLCEGKTKTEIAQIHQFIQVLHAAVRSYMI